MYYAVKVKVELPSGKSQKKAWLVNATSVTEAEVKAARKFADDGITYTVSDINETNFVGYIGDDE